METSENDDGTFGGKVLPEGNIAMLRDTLSNIEKGYSEVEAKGIPLRMPCGQTKKVRACLPRNVQRICSAKDIENVHVPGQ